MSPTQQISPHQVPLAMEAPPSITSGAKYARYLMLAFPGIAFIAILYGFAMSVMPHLSVAGKIAAIVLQAGITTSALALIFLPRHRAPLRDEIDHLAACDD